MLAKNNPAEIIAVIFISGKIRPGKITFYIGLYGRFALRTGYIAYYFVRVQISASDNIFILFFIFEILYIMTMSFVNLYIKRCKKDVYY